MPQRYRLYRWLAAAALGFGFTAIAAPSFAQTQPVPPEAQLPALADVPTGASPEMPTKALLLLETDGELTESDAVVPEDNSFYDLHTFDGEAGQVVTIAMDSPDFDTFLWLFAPDGRELAQNDDEGATSNSAIAITLPETGTYTICANAHGENMMGQYRVTVRTIPGR